MTKIISLALQGGGAHGAYTWGVLDRLMEEERLEIEGISGTSAGAMNGAVLISGHIKGGRDGAKDELRRFWRRVSDLNMFSPLQQSVAERLQFGWNLDWSLSYNWLDLMSRLYSPYDLNPLNLNPLRYVLEDTLDTKALQHGDNIKLFVTATHVESGQPQVFTCEEITVDVLLASACIPFMFQAIEINGEHYWDGGYMGNPVIWPIIYHCDTEDVVLVQINPLRREQHPRRAREIINRLNEITFNSSLIAEMRAIDFVHRLHQEGRLDRERYKDPRVHLIYSPDTMHNLDASSKMNASWEFFLYLHKLGYEAANQWLKETWKDIGECSSLDIREKFLKGAPQRKRKSPTPKPKAA